MNLNRNSLTVVTSAVLFLVLCLAQQSEAVTCYTCSSTVEGACGNAFDSTKATKQAGCSSCIKTSGEGYAGASDTKTTLVTRSCSNVEEKYVDVGCCKTSRSYNCGYACGGELCNSAHSVFPMSRPQLLAAISIGLSMICRFSLW